MAVVDSLRRPRPPASPLLGSSWSQSPYASASLPGFSLIYAITAFPSVRSWKSGEDKRPVCHGCRQPNLIDNNSCHTPRWVGYPVSHRRAILFTPRPPSLKAHGDLGLTRMRLLAARCLRDEWGPIGKLINGIFYFVFSPVAALYTRRHWRVHVSLVFSNTRIIRCLSIQQLLLVMAPCPVYHPFHVWGNIRTAHCRSFR